MDDLFDWMRNSKDQVHQLILSSIFHYEFVFILFADVDEHLRQKMTYFQNLYINSVRF